MTGKDRALVQELEAKIEALKARFPAHSIPPAMMAALDDLETQLAAAIKRQADKNQENKSSN